MIRRSFTEQERRWLRQEINLRKRERVSKSPNGGARVAKSKSSQRAKMSVADVEAAFRSYQDGISIDDLALVLWRKHGYTTAAHCSYSLRQRFFSMGFLTEAA